MYLVFQRDYLILAPSFSSHFHHFLSMKKVKPIAKMGEAVNNKRNISLRSMIPDQVLKCTV